MQEQVYILIIQVHELRRRQEDWIFDPLGLGEAGRPAFEREADVEPEDSLLAPIFRLIGGRGPNRPSPGGASPKAGAPRGGKGPEDTTIGIEDFFKGKLRPQSSYVDVCVSVSSLDITEKCVVV